MGNLLPYIRHCEPPLLLFGGEAIPHMLGDCFVGKCALLAMTEVINLRTLNYETSDKSPLPGFFV